MPTNNIMPDLEMTKNESELLFEYNISLSESYVKKKHGEICTICTKDVLMSYISPYLVAGVPSDKILQLTKERFGTLFEDSDCFITVEDINSHYNHFTTYSAGDKETTDNAAKYQNILDSDRVQETDVDKIMESNIRSLEAQRLIMEQQGLYGSKEYSAVISQLFKFVELKMKKNKMIEEDKKPISLSDLIKISSPGEITTDDNGRTTKKGKVRTAPK